MPKSTRYFAAAGSLGAGLAIAFVMQGTDASSPTGQAGMVPGAAPVAVAPVTDAPVTDAPVAEAAATDPALEISDLENTAAVVPTEAEVPEALPEPPVVTVAADDGTDPVLPDETAVDPIIKCPVTLTGAPRPLAMVRLSMEVSCMPGAMVTLHHNGMMFTETLDDAGAMTLDVPALDNNAVFIAALDNGEGAVAVVPVPDLDQYARVAVQWEGPLGVELHAREFGADYGSEDHHWSGAVGDSELALEGRGGFITRLGNGGITDRMSVEVYTFPSAATRKTGNVQLSVESEITAQNCGQTVAAQTLEVSEGADAPRVRDLTIDMPGCDAVGDYLVLQTIIEDLKVAAR